MQLDPLTLTLLALSAGAGTHGDRAPAAVVSPCVVNATPGANLTAVQQMVRNEFARVNGTGECSEVRAVLHG